MPDTLTDDFDIDGDIEDEGTAGNESSTTRQLRQKIRQLQQERKAERTELEELRTFRTEKVEAEKDSVITAAFKEVGLSEKQVALFKRVNPDVDPATVNADLVASFAAEYDLPTSGGEKVEAPEPKQEGFTPVTTGSAAPTGLLTQEDIRKLVSQGDMEAVNRAFAEGRVEKPDVPWTVPVEA